MELNPAAIDMNPAIVRAITAMLPNNYARNEKFNIGGQSTPYQRRTLITPDRISVEVGGSPLTIPRTYIDLDVQSNWDSLTPVDNSVAANRIGKDIYLYANANKLILSANATVPTGYDAIQVRRIAGLHCLGGNVGVISGHPFSGFLAGDIHLTGIWDLSFRPTCSPEGMFYDPAYDHFVDIYLQSGTGLNTRSAFGATITDTRTAHDHAEDLKAVGKKMLGYYEFSSAAAGGNEKTNIAGSADPVITGWHVDTAGRVMISALGGMSFAGVMWQWINEPSFRIDGLVDPTVNPAYGWVDQGSNKGSAYLQGSASDVLLLAGGFWNYGAVCGSRCRLSAYARLAASASFGSRGCAKRQGI